MLKKQTLNAGYVYGGQDSIEDQEAMRLRRSGSPLAEMYDRTGNMRVAKTLKHYQQGAFVPNKTYDEAFAEQLGAKQYGNQPMWGDQVGFDDLPQDQGQYSADTLDVLNIAADRIDPRKNLSLMNKPEVPNQNEFSEEYSKAFNDQLNNTLPNAKPFAPLTSVQNQGTDPVTNEYQYGNNIDSNDLMNYRINPEGMGEYSSDGGVTWKSAGNDAANASIINVVKTGNPTGGGSSGKRKAPGRELSPNSMDKIAVKGLDTTIGVNNADEFTPQKSSFVPSGKELAKPNRFDWQSLKRPAEDLATGLLNIGPAMRARNRYRNLPLNPDPLLMDSVSYKDPTSAGEQQAIRATGREAALRATTDAGKALALSTTQSALSRSSDSQRNAEIQVDNAEIQANANIRQLNLDKLNQFNQDKVKRELTRLQGETETEGIIGRNLLQTLGDNRQYGLDRDNLSLTRQKYAGENALKRTYEKMLKSSDPEQRKLGRDGLKSIGAYT